MLHKQNLFSNVLIELDVVEAENTVHFRLMLCIAFTFRYLKQLSKKIKFKCYTQ